MRKLLAILLFALPLYADAARELSLAREMLEDAAIRSDDEGLRLVRERLLRVIAEADDRTTQRDAHYLVALSAQFERFSGYRDAGATAALIATGIRHIDRALELDERFADGWMLAALLHGRVPGPPNRVARALELDARSPGVAMFYGMLRSFNPAGPAPPEGAQIIDELAARLDADRASTGRRFGLWDANAHAWALFVRMATDDPHPEALRPMVARLLAERPDFALARQIDDALRERHFATAPDVQWQPLLTDPAGDGANPKWPDVVAVDRAESGDRLWYRVSFREPLPRSFGVNLIFDRDGDPATGMRWWGGGSAFRFDRLVTAWITRDGDRFSGRVGVTDDDGARGANLTKLTTDVLVAMGGDERSVIVGVPKSVLALTDASAMIVAGGSHLAWNDDATSASKSR